MTRYKPPTIQEKGGLKVHLDQTKERHNGKGYADFVRMMSPDTGFRKVDIKREFGISYPTLYNWIELYEGEQNG